MPNFVYGNKLVENKYNSVLVTDLQDSEFMTVDESLTNKAGEIVEIVTRSVSGNVENVAMGVGNTADVTVTGIKNPYKVVTKQGRFTYYDEEVNADPMTVDAGVKGLAEVARNAWVAEAFTEVGKAYSKNVASASIGFNDFADAVALFGEKDQDLRALVHPETVATLRKNLKDDLKYSEAFARTGYIGTCCGVPIKRTAAAPKGEVIIMQKDAVTLFVKKNTEIEQNREPNTRKNEIYTRKVAICALTNEAHVVRIAASAGTSATVTTATKATKTIAGAATTGAIVRAYVNGVYAGMATATSNAYSITAENNLVAGDEVLVIAHKDGEVATKATKTVSA